MIIPFSDLSTLFASSPLTVSGNVEQALTNMIKSKMVIIFFQISKFLNLIFN